jgi:hypothetical protein
MVICTSQPTLCVNATDDEAYGMVINSNSDLGIAGAAVNVSSDFQMIVIEQ